jgi:SAM-dependent methyltransferase
VAGVSGGHGERVREQFTAQVERFARSAHVNAEEPLRRFLALARPRPEDRALDVACGPGLLAKAVAPLVRDFLGVDLTHAMLVKARALAPRARFVVGDALALPLADATRDLVLTRLALHHIPEPARAIAEMARVLAPGGRLAIFDLASSEVEEEARYEDVVERLRDPSHAHALAISELVRAAGRAGLELAALDAMDFAIDVEDWIARAEQSREAADEARRLLEAAVGTRRFGGKRVWRDAAHRLFFAARWVMILAEKPRGD